MRGMTPARAISPCAALEPVALFPYSQAQEIWRQGTAMGQAGIRRTAFALLALVMLYAAFTGMGG